MTVLIPKIPHKLEDLLGRDGTDEFVDFLNQTLHANNEDVIQVVGDRFERRLVEETGKLRTEIADVRTEIAGWRSEMKSDHAVLHRDISLQTRWILTVLLAAGVLYPILNQIIAK